MKTYFFFLYSTVVYTESFTAHQPLIKILLQLTEMLWTRFRVINFLNLVQN